MLNWVLLRFILPLTASVHNQPVNEEEDANERASAVASYMSPMASAQPSPTSPQSFDSSFTSYMRNTQSRFISENQNDENGNDDAFPKTDASYNDGSHTSVIHVSE